MTLHCVLLIILWWLSTGRKGRNVWCCSIMSWKCRASGQTHCIYLMVGSWKNVRHWGHFGALWASQKAGWCKSKEALGVVDAQPKCSVLLAAEVFCLFSIGIPKALWRELQDAWFLALAPWAVGTWMMRSPRAGWVRLQGCALLCQFASGLTWGSSRERTEPAAWELLGISTECVTEHCHFILPATGAGSEPS